MDSIVKLTVKTPNQQLKDIEVNCNQNWSVRKLKEFLTDVYPTKPDSSQVRLIYSGHLLSDEVQLKEIFIEDGTSNIVHIVCPHLPEDAANCKRHEMKQSPTYNLNDGSSEQHHGQGSTGQQQGYSQAPIQQATRGISHPEYNTTSSYAWMQYMSKMQEYYAMMYYYQQQQQPAWWNASALQQWQMNIMSNQGYNAWSTGSQYWPQNASQHAFGNSALSSPVADQAQQREAPDVIDAAQNEADLGAQDDAVDDAENQANPAPPLNAGGAMFNDEDENEDGRRDWLDWVHTFLRASVMLSIMYFYSSTVRILMIGLLGFIIYLYQAGWFLPRRVPRVADAVNNDNQNDNRDQQGGIHNDIPTENNENAQLPGESEQSQRVLNEREYGVLNTFYTFVTSFFTSLLPQGT